MQEQLCTCLTRYEPGARRELDRVRDVLLEDLPPLCVSLVQRRDYRLARKMRLLRRSRYTGEQRCRKADCTGTGTFQE